jgi:serine/threonine protein kinase
LLYELVTGRWPFEEVYAQEDGDRYTTERQFPQITGALPPAPRAFRADMSETLEQTIMTCLSPDPADRYASMHPLLLALASELAEPVSLWPPGVRAERRQLPRD